LVNVGRGGLVDETALFAALDRGAPEHAYLDVVREEPLSEDSLIWTHPNISLTPHIAALTDGSMIRTDSVFLENVERFFNGQTLKNAVERDVFS